jgi:hypothetical protein
MWKSYVGSKIFCSEKNSRYIWMSFNCVFPFFSSFVSADNNFKNF